jgi:hypothetical protein
MVTAPPPQPGGGPPGPFRSNRCVACGGELSGTQATGRPQRDDHLPNCTVFDRALQVMRYAEELRRAASGATGRSVFRADHRQQRYLQKKAKELSAAACADGPALAVGRLARQYEGEHGKGGKEAAIAEILMQACMALAQGQDPAPITSLSG